jgi:PAS domain S-box-containing protein
VFNRRIEEERGAHDRAALRLAAIVQSSDDAIISTDLTGTILTWNPAAERMYGFSEAEAVGQSITIVISPELRGEQMQLIARLKNGEHVDHYETVRITKAGKPIDVSLTLSPLKDPTDAIVGISGIVRDIAERKRSERALRGQLEFERFLFDLSRTFIGLPEAEVDVNMARGLGQVGEFLEMDRVTLFELSPDRTGLTVAYSWSASGVGSTPGVIAQRALPFWISLLLRGDVACASRVEDLPEEAAGEREYFRQQGFASAASIPLKVGGEIAGAIGFVTLHRSVTWTEELVNQLRAIGDILWNALKRRQAMQALLDAQAFIRDSEERFRLAMSNVAAGVYTLDLDGLVTYVNPAAEAMFGWTNVELLGKKMHDVTHYKHPDGTPFPASECPGQQALQQGVELREHEDMFIRKDGRFFPVVYSASPLKKNGTTVGIVVGVRDETERLESERALREREALRASEDRYRGLAEQVVDSIFVTDAAGRYVDANRSACELLGYTLNELKTLGVEDVLDADEHRKLPDQFRRLASGAVVRNEWRFRRKDGSGFTGELVARQLPDGRLQGVVRDVTERKEAEELQRRLHELATLPLSKVSVKKVLGAIVETAVAVAHADFGTIQLLDAESSSLRIAAQHGFPQWWVEYWQSISKGRGACGCAWEKGERIIVEDLEQGSVFSGVDLEMHRKAGVRATQSTPLVSRSGKLIGVFSTHYKTPGRPDEGMLQRLDLLAREAADVIGQAQADAELQRQAALLDLAQNCIFVRDQDGHVTYWNQSSVDYYGWTREEALGAVANVLLQTQFPEPLAGILAAIKSTGHWEGEIVHTCRDGRRLTMDSRWAIQHGAEGEDFRILEINNDITARKQAETALRESEQQLQSYIDQAGDAIYLLDGDTGRILSANTRALEMLGYSRDELLRMSAADIEREHPPERIDQVHRTLSGVVEVQGTHRRKDGSSFPVEIRLAALAPTPPHRILSIVRDISERKRLERERAEEAKRKDEFLAFLGHELRNPLAAIHTATQVLSMGVAPEQRARMEDIIGRQTAMMRRLVDDLLDLERITHGQIELKRGRVDLAECLRRAVAVMQATVATRRQALVLELPSAAVPFMADSTRLDQIVGNLLSNASKYTGPGGKIEVSGTREGSDVVIRCKDNGKGIAPELRQKIFEPFVRGSRTEFGYGEASVGLGLALVKQLAELHGGTISVESGGPGLGSVFTLRLPLVAPPFDSLREEPQPAHESHRAQSIVIVEDNPSVAAALEAALGQAGHSVHLFADGPSTLAGVSAVKPDALLIDIGLPGMDGYELAARLKQQTGVRNALYVAVSGFKRRKPEGVHDEFDHYFSKPVDVPALLALLDTR